MSYWIYLIDEKGETVNTDTLREEGATYALGGIIQAELNVTYNYRAHFNFRQLDNMGATEAIPILTQKINKLADDENPDYWKTTEGNVKRALKTLLEFAEYAVNNNINAKFVVH